MALKVNTDRFTPADIAAACMPCRDRKNSTRLDLPASGTCELGPNLLAVVQQRGVTEQEMKAGISYALGKRLDRSPDTCPLQEISSQKI